jgi:hypothetical protein
VSPGQTWIAIAPRRDAPGYVLASEAGSLLAFDGSKSVPSPTRPYIGLQGHIVGLQTMDTRIWLVGSDGGVIAYGTGGFYGSLAHTALNAPIVGMTLTRDGRGYWLVGADGGVFAFGDASFHGSNAGASPSSSFVGIAES